MRDQEERLYQSVRDFYGTSASLEYYGRKLESDQLFPPEEALVAKYMSKPGTVLDIGCGTGRVTFYLARRGFQIQGIDVTPELVDYGNRFASTNGLRPCLQLGDGKTLPFPAASYDYVLLISQMIHHVPLRANRIGLLKEAARVCRSGGVILLTFHDIDTLRREKPWDPDWVTDKKGVQEFTDSFSILEPGDAFGDNSSGDVVSSFGYNHNFTSAEMMDTVAEAGLKVAVHDSFRTIAGGEPDTFWSATQLFILRA